MGNGQRELQMPAWYRADRLFPELLERFRELCDRLERKEVLFELSHSDDLRMTPQYLDNALLDRNRHSVKARHLLWALLRDESGELLAWLAGQCGYEIEAAAPLTPEEELRKLQELCRRELGPAGERLVREAKER